MVITVTAALVDAILDGGGVIESIQGTSSDAAAAASARAPAGPFRAERL